MADEAPASLRQADANIFKTATRAAQLQAVKPIVAYWCEYWVLKQIIAKSLHTSSSDILEYSTQLMDKLEQTKADHATEDAILDDTAGQAYVEQFAQETLDRAQRVVRANKVTANTANTFDAAASFFALVNIWGTPDQETLQKIKYAKWNAARILKAIKEGKDPNESNPHPEEVQQDTPMADSLSLPEVPPTTPRPVTIKDVPDRDLRRDSAGVSLPRSPSSADGSRAVSSGDAQPQPPSPPVFDPGDPDDSVPVVPSPSSAPPVSQWTAPPPADPEPFYQPQPPPAAPPLAQWTPPAREPPPSAVPQWPPQASAPPSNVANPAAIDELAMANAQKHAKWAISALNFEDVSTAVRELHKALEFLGA